MDDYISKTINAYDDTETYEKSTELLVPEPELNQFLTMLEHGGAVLDAGCAFGRDSNYIKSKGFNVKAIDLSPALINRARELYPDIEFNVSDIRKTNFEDGTFDGIWCNATLLHLNDTDMQRALLEFRRVLKPDGTLAISLKKGDGEQRFVENFSSKSERYFNFKTHETFLEQLRATGLHEVSWHYMNERERYGKDKRDLDWLYSFSMIA